MVIAWVYPAFKAGDHTAVFAHQEFLKIPGDRASGLGLGESVKGGSVRGHLVHQLKADAVVVGAEGFDLFDRAGLLGAEVIAREADHFEALLAVALVELLQTGVLLGEPALAGHIHDQQDAAVVGGQIAAGAIG